ncbi:T9SS C-terminal target domain-containing protein [Prevotella sp. OH937_COT-195]|nr:T9SS C-terminal target domain-containing protein [Prevotella sp. OH937_COT-195]
MTMTVSPLQAQVKLVVTPQNGSKASEYALQDISKIVFGADGMHIIGANIVPEPVWSLSEIKTITFANVVTDISQVNDNSMSKMSISQNGDMLYVHGLEAETNANAAIFDISGKTLLRTKTAKRQPIDIAELRQGIYIIKVNNATFKFVRQ